MKPELKLAVSNPPKKKLVFEVGAVVVAVLIGLELVMLGILVFR